MIAVQEKAGGAATQPATGGASRGDGSTIRSNYTPKFTNRQPYSSAALWANIPAELKTLPQWLYWRLQPRKDKPAKIPYDANRAGQPAATNDPATWASYDQAATIAGRLGVGVGFVFSADDSYTGIDFDDCLDAAGNLIVPEVAEWLRWFASYTEVSPSGTGLKTIVRGKLPRAIGHKPGAPVKIEAYSAGRFFTLTGRVFGNYRTIANGEAALDALNVAYGPPAMVERPRPTTTTTAPVTTELLERVKTALGRLSLARCDDFHGWIRVGFALKELGEPGLHAWDAWSRNSDKWTEGDCARRWEHFRSGAEEAPDRPLIRLNSLFTWANEDDPQPGQAAPDPTLPAAGAVLAAERATAPHGPAPLPAPRPVLPWKITREDWGKCPICGTVNHDCKVTTGGLFNGHIYRRICRKRECPVSRKVRAADLLEPILDWSAIYTVTVSVADWDAVYMRLRRGAARWLAFDQWGGETVRKDSGKVYRVPNGEIVVVCDRAEPLPGAAITDDLQAIYNACDNSTKVRRPHARTRERLDADVYAALAVDLGELDRGRSIEDVFDLKERKKRIKGVKEDARALNETSESHVLARQLTITLPPDTGYLIRDAWARCGIHGVNGRAQFTIEQGRALLAEFEKIREGLRREGVRDVSHRVGWTERSKSNMRPPNGANVAPGEAPRPPIEPPGNVIGGRYDG